jgi:hypothetical protein
MQGEHALMSTQWLSRLVAAPLLLVLAGCASTGLFKTSKDQFPKDSPKNPIIRIVALWQPTEGLSGNKKSRGFTGQIYFFSQNGDIPARADGDVRIYVFDDQGTPEQNAKWMHEEVFPAASWDALLCKGTLGATYSVFVPYIRPGIHEAKCALRINYTPKSGPPVFSDMVDIILPGVKKPKVGLPGETTADESKTAAEAPDLSDRQSANLTPPAARGPATKLPTVEEIQEQLRPKRVTAVELDAKERRRLMREATARLESRDDTTSAVSLAGYEEPDADDEAADNDDNSNGRRIRNAQTDAAASLESDTEDEPSAAVTRHAKRAKTHILDDDE